MEDIISKIPDDLFYSVAILFFSASIYRTLLPIWDSRWKPYLPGDKYYLLPAALVGLIVSIWKLIS